MKAQITNPTSHQYKICALSIDEMDIRKQITWNKSAQEFEGIPTSISGSSGCDVFVSMAPKALVVVATGINGHWKVPLGYWLTKGISGKLQYEILLGAIKKLYDIGITAVSVTFNGAAANVELY